MSVLSNKEGSIANTVLFRKATAECVRTSVC